MAMYAKMSTGKAWAATFGAVATFLVLMAGFFSDGKLDGGELATGVGALVTLVGTIYGVWRTRNVPVTTPPDVNVR